MHGNKKGYNSHQNNYARINPSILIIYRTWVLIHQLFQFWGVADQNEEGRGNWWSTKQTEWKTFSMLNWKNKKQQTMPPLEKLSTPSPQYPPNWQNPSNILPILVRVWQRGVLYTYLQQCKNHLISIFVWFIVFRSGDLHGANFQNNKILPPLLALFF